MTNIDTNEKEYEILIYNVIWLREHHALSKRKMAGLLGISTGSLNKLENGKIPPRLGVRVFYSIHKNFGISPSILISKRLEASKIP